jgi:hypothetical protein
MSMSELEIVDAAAGMWCELTIISLTLKTLPLNHLSHDIPKTFYVPLKGNPHSLKAQHSVEHCPRRTYNLLGNTFPRRFTHLNRRGRTVARKKEPTLTKVDRRLPNCHELQRWRRMMAQRRRGNDRRQRLS